MSEHETVDENGFDKSVWAPRRHYEVRRPPNFQLEEGDGWLRLTHRWFSVTAFLTLPMGLFCWMVPIGMYLSVAADRQLKWIVVLVMAIIFIPVGALFIYVFLMDIFNRSVIHITPREINIQIKPLPSRGNMRIDAQKIEQVYCRGIGSRDTRGRRNTDYVLCARMSDGSDRIIYQATDYKEDLRYLEQQIERILGIRDEAVEGEAP
ncbi:MAG: hypothetical protein AAGB29_10930 [Planctomycetota bacterium]